MKIMVKNRKEINLNLLILIKILNFKVINLIFLFLIFNKMIENLIYNNNVIIIL